MLNTYGRGEVYFGIDDHGKVLGLTTGRTAIKDVTRAVVTKDVPEYAIIGGVPAKVIKYRKTQLSDVVKKAEEFKR